MTKTKPITEEMICDKCGKPIYYEDTGYYFHYGKVDGKNGLYCIAEAWNLPTTKMRNKYLAEPRRQTNDR